MAKLPKTKVGLRALLKKLTKDEKKVKKELSRFEKPKKLQTGSILKKLQMRKFRPRRSGSFEETLIKQGKKAKLVKLRDVGDNTTFFSVESRKRRSIGSALPQVRVSPLSKQKALSTFKRLNKEL
jgi:hypothetical protein